MYYILGPRSFTGEDCCEFQIHGGRAVIASVLHGLSKLPDFRPADPGEWIWLHYFITSDVSSWLYFKESLSVMDAWLLQATEL